MNGAIGYPNKKEGRKREGWRRASCSVGACLGGGLEEDLDWERFSLLLRLESILIAGDVEGTEWDAASGKVA